MKSLIRVILIIAACFAATFIVIKSTGILTVEHIENWLLQAKELSPFFVGSLVALLLFADLFIAVPTLTITILSGYFLGHTYGFISALSGVTMAGICSHTISRYYGNTLLGFLVKDRRKQKEVISAFQRHGFIMILLSRAVPILPEVTACLSGMVRMNFGRFLLAWSISSVPYILIASYAGSISTIQDPKPAILAATALTLLLWGLWFLFHRLQKNNR